MSAFNGGKGRESQWKGVEKEQCVRGKHSGPGTREERSFEEGERG